MAWQFGQIKQSSVLIIVYLLLNRLKCQILQTWN
jgi:hypothetical protein